MSVYFFYGDEDFNIESTIQKMRSKLNPDFLSMNYQTFDNPNYATLINILRTPPMMFGNTLLVINAEKYFFKVNNKEVKFEDKELEDIEDALNSNPDGVDIVFSVKIPTDEDGTKKIDTRRKLFKLLKNFNFEEFKTIPTYKTAEISTWITNRAKSKNITLKPDAIELLIEHIGNNLRQFDAELDKLVLLAYPEKNVTKKMVEEVTISNQDLFNITEYIISGNKGSALLEFKKLSDKQHPLKILSAIQTILRKWIIIKSKSTNLSTIEISKIVGQHEFVVKQTIQKLKKTNLSDLVKLKNNLFEAEYKIKNAEVLDITMEVENALIR